MSDIFSYFGFAMCTNYLRSLIQVMYTDAVCIIYAVAKIKGGGTDPAIAGTVFSPNYPAPFTVIFVLSTRNLHRAPDGSR